VLSEIGLLISVVAIVFALFVILVERKLLAYAMRRVGPMIMGRNGAFQILLDLVKLLSKETFLIPRPTSVLAPIFLTFFFTIQVLFAHNYVWGPTLFMAERVDSMILYHLILILFSNIFFTVIGLLSQSRYALIAITRALVHVISLDIFVTVVYSLLVFINQSTNFHDFVITQNYFWIFILFSPIASGFLVLFLLESKRTPFDHAETEAEVVAGYATEYNGAMLLFLYLTEYIHLIIASVHFVVFFFGGWYLLSYLWFLPAIFISAHDVSYWLQITL